MVHWVASDFRLRCSKTTGLVDQIIRDIPAQLDPRLQFNETFFAPSQENRYLWLLLFGRLLPTSFLWSFFSWSARPYDGLSGNSLDVPNIGY